MGSEGVLYEPRSLWSIANVDITGNTGPTRIRLPRRHFFNGERYPYQLKRIALCAVNFGFIDPLSYHEGAAQLSACEVQISVPQRYHVNSKQFLVDASFMPRPTWAPRERLVGGQQPSALWNQAMLKFDKAFYLPQRGSIEWSLSSFTPWRIDDQSFQTLGAFATMGYQEEGGLFMGSMRAKRVPLLFMDGTATSQIPADTEEKWPYPPDALFVPGGEPPLAGAAQGFWDPRGHYSARDFDRQESTRSGSTKLTDMRVAIDQRQMDAEMQTAFATANQPCPLSLRTGTRVRTTSGGTNAWWWRPGAPLGLVFDHLTPANVYELPEMVTLRAGDQLEVEMTFPAPFPQSEPPPLAPSAYHIGIAFNGYAVIEG